MADKKQSFIKELEESQLSYRSRREKEEEVHGDHPTLVRSEKATRRNPRLVRPMRFTSLHHHSTYSFLDGFQLPEAHVRRVSELNGSALALTEHGNVMSHPKFEQAASAEGIKPIFGIELYCGDIDEERRRQMKNHLTILARNDEGYQNILRLVSRSYKEGFYYAPTVSGRMLREASPGLVVLSGCQSSLLYTSLAGGKGIEPREASYRRARGVARRFRDTFDGSYFIEVQAFPELDSTREANPLLARMARELGIPLVATLDCHYTLPTEKEIQKTLHSIRSGGRDTPDDLADSWGYTAELCPPLSDRQIIKKLTETGLTKEEAIRSVALTGELAQDLTVDLPRLKMVRYKVPDGKTSLEVWREWLREGWHFRGVDRMSRRERLRYEQRLKYEMSIIEEKDFIDYFLIVSDAVRFAKDANIGVGPARGSAAASLVCFLLRITEVNPMLFPHLVFERFIDITREDLPDIDLDFESARRSEIVDFLVSRYGRDCVSQIGTFTKFKSKLALDDVARVHRIPGFETQQIKDVLLERSSGDLRASATIEDTIEQFDQARAVIERHPELMIATELEGNLKTFGVHAAGIAISNDPITSVTSILERQVKGRAVQVVAMDKYDAEYLGVLKIDFLGLSAIDALVEMCKGIGEQPDFLYTIPTEDDETIKGFKENDVVGIFQYEGRATRMVNGSIKPDSFDEVCHITALSRPGPLHNGAVADYVDIKHGVKQPQLVHPALNEITAFTQFQVVYQEQILRIVREIGGFDWTHASYIRKIISRKLGDAEFNRQWDRFWEGVQRLHPDRDEATARAIWGLCTTAGSYAFNAAHSISYGYIAWWTMWFKRHHTEVFYPAMLHRADKKTAQGGGAGGSANAKATVTSRAKLDPQVIMIRDAMNSNGQFSRRPMKLLPYDLHMSDVTWRGEADGLRPGFDQIEGIGEKTAVKIIEWRDQRKPTPKLWEQMIEISGIGEKTITRIVENATEEDPFKIMRLDRMIDAVKKDLPRLQLPNPTHTAVEVPYERGDEATEVVWVGVAVHKNLRDIFEVNRARTGEELDPAEVKHPELNEWMLVAGYDGTDLLTLRFNRWRYPSFKNILWKIKMNDDVLLVQGIKPTWRAAREIEVTNLWVLDPQL
jgi:DNA polymerase-3 subunit alpha